MKRCPPLSETDRLTLLPAIEKLLTGTTCSTIGYVLVGGIVAFAACSGAALMVAAEPLTSVLPFCRPRPRRAGSMLGAPRERGYGPALMASAAAHHDPAQGSAREQLVDSSGSVSVLPEITVLTCGYPPAHLMGGPTRSLFVLVEALAADFNFSVITSVFDDPVAGPMRSVKPGQWGMEAGGYAIPIVRGLSPSRSSIFSLSTKKGACLCTPRLAN